MFDYGEHIDLDRVILQDCIDLCEKKEISSVINDGRIINFEKEGE